MVGEMLFHLARIYELCVGNAKLDCAEKEGKSALEVVFGLAG